MINAHMTWGPYIQLVWPETASEDDIKAYTEMINQLPGAKYADFWGMELKEAIFVVNDKGTLDLTRCTKKN